MISEEIMGIFYNFRMVNTFTSIVQNPEKLRISTTTPCNKKIYQK